MTVWCIISDEDGSLRAIWKTQEQADKDNEQRNKGRYETHVEEWRVKDDQ